MKKINDCTWEVDEIGSPIVPRIFVSDKMMEAVETDAIKQITNVSALPGCVGAMAMPDIHVGDGLPIGGVAAFRMDTGVITPAAVGFDINCGVRLLRTNIPASHFEKRGMDSNIYNYVEAIITELYKKIPSGMGPGNRLSFENKELDEIFTEGPMALVRRGYGDRNDIRVCEENGCMDNADVSFISDKVRDRGRSQVGTLGGGNHFIEIQKVDDVYEPDIAKKFGIEKGMICVMIHSGSRGAGHQICGEYKNSMKEAMLKYGIKTRDPELTPAPINSPEGQSYLNAMACGANYGWANRHMLGHFVREVFENRLDAKVETVYDVAHNIAKFEQHGGEEYCVVRKGATRAFAAGRSECGIYQDTGHPVLIPGSMGTSSYVLVGTQTAMDLTYGSVNHGAGRSMSRSKAKKKITLEQVNAQLSAAGVVCKAPTAESVIEESPDAYKDIDDVIDVVTRVGLARKVARMLPIAVMKG